LKGAEKPNPTLLLGFTEPLVTYSAILVRKRLEWIQKLENSLRNTAQSIYPENHQLRLIYLSNWVPEIGNLSYHNNNLESVYFTGHGPLPSLQLLENAFWGKAALLEAAEWKSKHTLIGPQRDDWTFFRGHHVLKGHGSQGEVRSALLALKLCEVELFCKATQHRPVFLLDDFSSELDRQRRSFLLRFLENTNLQVFVTSTEDQMFGGKKYYVVNESVNEAEHVNRDQRNHQNQ
jgi:recombinational DNA repair ATPase RecF